MMNEVEKMKALSDETRFRIMRLLAKADTEVCACEIMDVLNKPQYSISKSLGILVSAGLINERREGKMMMYCLKKDGEFNLKTFDMLLTVKCASNESIKNDVPRMKRRLSLREKGKCVISCCPDL